MGFTMAERKKIRAEYAKFQPSKSVNLLHFSLLKVSILTMIRA
jgi:hypothetical protein